MDNAVTLGRNATDRLLDRLVYNKHPVSVTVIEVFAVFGLIICWAGYRLVKPCMFLAGCLLAFMIFYTVSPLVFKSHICCAANGKEIVHVLLSVLIGVVGGVLGCRLYRLGIFTIGQCLGLVVALVILSTPLYKYFQSNIAYAFFMTVVSMIVGTLAQFYEKPTVIAATAFVGSFAFLYGLDHFLKTSFSVTAESFLLRIKSVAWDGLKSEYSNWTYRAQIPDHLAVRFTRDCIPMFAMWGVGTALGTAIQFKITAKNLKSGSSVRQLCDYCGAKEDK